MKKQFILIYFLIFSSLLYGQSDLGFTVKGGLNFPVGDFTTYYNAGLGGFGGLFYNINKTTRISFSVGYNSWSLDLDALNQELKNSGNTGKYDVEAPVKAVSILLNVKFFWRENENFHPYLVLEAGIYNTTREVFGRYIYDTGESLTVNPSTTTSSDGSFIFGGGFEYPVNEVIALDVSAKYHLLLSQDVYNFGDAGYGTSYSTINFISVFAGINVFFQ